MEHTVGAGDKESISHPKPAAAHDDVSAAVAGAIMMALWAAKRAAQEPKIVMPFVTSNGLRYFPGSPTHYYEPLADPWSRV